MDIYDKQEDIKLMDEPSAVEEPAAPAQEEERPLPMASGVGRRKRSPERPGLELSTGDESNSSRPTRQPSKLGRGGATAIAVLVVFVPLIIGLIYLFYDANTKVDGLQTNLRALNSTTNSQSSSDFAVLLSENNLQILPFKAEDQNPIGKVVLYSAGRLRWAVIYGKLEPLPNGQMYVMWLNRKATPYREQGYERLALMPDVRTGGSFFVLKESDFPPSFLVANYSELVVTIEPVDQSVDKPTGPRRYSLDLSKVVA
jgi:hypothetical protein